MQVITLDSRPRAARDTGQWNMPAKRKKPEAGNGDVQRAGLTPDSMFPPAILEKRLVNGRLLLGFKEIATMPPLHLIPNERVQTNAGNKRVRSADVIAPNHDKPTVDEHCTTNGWRKFLARFPHTSYATQSPDVTNSQVGAEAAVRADTLANPIHARLSVYDENAVANLAMQGISAAAIADRYRSASGSRIDESNVRRICNIYAPPAGRASAKRNKYAFAVQNSDII